MTMNLYMVVYKALTNVDATVEYFVFFPSMCSWLESIKMKVNFSTAVTNIY